MEVDRDVTPLHGSSVNDSDAIPGMENTEKGGDKLLGLGLVVLMTFQEPAAGSLTFTILLSEPAMHDLLA